jgi:hypothetical protein
MLVIITFAPDRHFRLVDIGDTDLGDKYNSRQRGGEVSSTVLHTPTIQGTALCDVSVTGVVGEDGSVVSLYRCTVELWHYLQKCNVKCMCMLCGSEGP